MTQKERQENSKREIFRAAMEEFGTKEYETVTMEGICAGHKISKGMMYHYYSNKDQLFLLCVADTFQKVKEYVEQATDGQRANTFEAIQHFFLLRERYFEHHPLEKNVFENAMIHPPKHLARQITQLHQPLQQLNRDFLRQVISHMQLRPGLSPADVASYLECVAPVFPTFVHQLQEQKTANTHSMLCAAEQVLQMILYGVVQEQPETMGSKSGPL